MVSQKYSNLVIAKKNGLLVPDFIFVDFEDNYLDEIKKFIGKSKSKYFIIRSAIPIEDGNNKSYAGHFYSSSKIDKKNIFEEIEISKQKNEDLIRKYGLLGIKVNLFIQEYIEMKKGGVIFYPWKFFNKHFLVDFSSNANLSVEGRDISNLIVSIDNKYDCSLGAITKVTDIDLNLISKLKKLVIELEKLFNFKFDAEFAFDGKLVYLLQIRPVTIEPVSLISNSSNDAILKNIENLTLDKKFNSEIDAQKYLINYVYNDFCESLGVLSPLSYSLILKLYLDSKDDFKKLHFKAEKIDFLFHLTDGSVLVNSKNYVDFFSNLGFFSSFKRAFEKQKNFDMIKDYLLNNIELIFQNKSFDYDSLKKLFIFWQYSIIYSYFFEKENYTGNVFYSNEYELSNFLDIKIDNIKYDNLNNFKTWNELRLFLKNLFLFELDKLKLSLKKIPNYSFLTFDEYLNLCQNKIIIKDSILIKKYIENLKYSIYEIDLNKIYSLNDKLNIKTIDLEDPYNKSSSNSNSFSGFFSSNSNKSKTNFSNLNNYDLVAEVIKNPNSYKGIFQENSVLFAPYFRNEWISQIDKFKAIVLENGGLLSHSAIVAREKSIFYQINQKTITNQFQTGDKIYFDSKTNSFQKK